VVIAVLACALAAGCSESQTYRYRLSATIESAGRVFLGQTVVQVRVIKQPPIGGIGSRYEVIGDAVRIDIPGGSPVFALLGSRASSSWAAEILFDTYGTTEQNSGLLRVAPGAHVIPPDRYPMVIGFTNPALPGTAFEITPPRNPPAPVGTPISVSSMSIEITNDPVTLGAVEAVLPWVLMLKTNLSGTIGQSPGGAVTKIVAPSHLRMRVPQ
jgi:hypothetical protein